jgi:signal transduction histidine kinase
MRPRRLIFAALTASAALWFVAWIGVFLGSAVAIHVENAAWCGAAFTAAAAAFFASRDPRSGRTRRSFRLLGLGSFAWGLGQAAWSVYVLRGDEIPYPSFADVGYLAAMPLFAAAVLTWPRRRRAWGSGALFDAALAATAGALISFELSLEPIIEGGIHGLQGWVGFAYPLGELAIVVIVSGGLLLDGWADRTRLTIVGLGLLALAVSDTAFALDALDDSLSAAFDPGWTLAFVGIGVAALARGGWTAGLGRRVPDVAAPIVVACSLAILAGFYALKHIHDGAARDALIIGALLVLVAARAFHVTRVQARQTALLAEARDALHEAQATRDRFLVELVNAQEREARKIADLLHDDVVQQLTALGFRLELEAQRHELRRLRELAHDTGVITGSIRRLLVELHPAILESQGLGPAIDVVAEGLRERGIDVRVTPFPHRLGRETETLAYRLVQEALGNVLRHSAAPTAEVELRVTDGTLRGRVSDSGLGIPPHEASLLVGIGLLVARERVELAGGRLLVDAGREHGTDFVFELPLDAETVEAKAVPS